MSANQPDVARFGPEGEVKKPAESQQFSITLDRVAEYEFRIRFDKGLYADLVMDEPPPAGHDKGPNASRLLAAAVGNCLSASLLFCAQKARVDIRKVHTDVTVSYARNEQGRLRIGRVAVTIRPEFESADLPKARRCLEIFEDYCVVTQSVRKGIDVEVAVQIPQHPPGLNPLKSARHRRNQFTVGAT